MMIAMTIAMKMKIKMKIKSQMGWPYDSFDCPNYTGTGDSPALLRLDIWVI